MLGDDVIREWMLVPYHFRQLPALSPANSILNSDRPLDPGRGSFMFL